MIQVAPEQVRQITQDVLAGPEFAERLTWTDLLLHRVLGWLSELTQWAERNPGLSRILMYGLTAILVLLVGHIVYTVVREFISLRKTDGRPGFRQPLRALEGVAKNWSEAFELAKTALDAGDLYRALWITHRILLSVLDGMGRIKFVRWKTNSDYLRECADAGDIGGTLSELTGAYERVVYAHTEFDRQQAVKLLAQVETLAAQTRQ